MPERTILLLIYILAGVISVSILLVLMSELWKKFLRQQTEKKVQECKEFFEDIGIRPESEYDQLVSYILKKYDLSIIEPVLDEAFEKSSPEQKVKLRNLYEKLDLISFDIKELEESSEWSHRAHAAKKLGWIGHSQAVKVLIKHLQDPEEEANVKRCCSDALRLIHDEAAIPFLVDSLSQVDAVSTPLIVNALVGFGKKVIPAVLPKLKDPKNENVRINAAHILGEIQSLEAIPSLIQELSDMSELVREACVVALGKIEDREAVNPLINLMLYDSIPNVRLAAAAALGKIADEKALAPLVQVLNDPSHWTRIHAVEALEMIGPKAQALLEKALDDTHKEIRYRAATALERLGVVQENIRALASQDQETRRISKDFLINIGKSGALQAMKNYCHSHDNFQVRALLCEILGQVGNPQAQDSLIRAVKDNEWGVRAEALSALAKIKGVHIVDELITALSDDEETVREKAVELFSRIDVAQLKGVLDKLRPALKDPNFYIRRSAFKVLIRFADGKIIPEIMEARVDSDSEVRRIVAQALGKLKDPKAMIFLVDMLKDEEQEVQIEAVLSLRKMADQTVIKPLIQLFKDADDKLREIVSESLATIKIEPQDLVDHLMELRDMLSRVGACLTLGKIKHPVHPAVVKLLHIFIEDAEEKVRVAAATALSQIKDSSSLEALLKHLEDASEWVRAESVIALGQLKNTSAVKPILKTLSDPDIHVRKKACIALGYLHSEEALAGLSLLLKHRDLSLVASAVIGISMIGNKKFFSDVMNHFKDEKIKKEVLIILEKEDSECMRQFFSFLDVDYRLYLRKERGITDQDFAVQYERTLRGSLSLEERSRALSALELIGDSAAWKSVARSVLRDPSPEVRLRAIEVLTHLANPEDTCKTLIEALGDTSNKVRMGAIQKLGGLGLKAANEALVSCFDINDRKTREALSDALAEINKEDASDITNLIMGTEDKNVLLGLIMTLGKVEDTKTSQLLSQFLKPGSDSALKAAATIELGKKGGFKGVETFLSAMNDPNEEVRISTVQALAELIERDVLDALIRLSFDPVETVRATVAEVLINFINTKLSCDDKVIRVLKQLSEDRKQSVQTQALISLFRIGSSDAFTHVARSYKDLTSEAKLKLESELETKGVIEDLENIISVDKDVSRRTGAVKLFGLVNPAKYKDILLKALKDPNSDVRLEALESLKEVEDLKEVAEAIEELMVREPMTEVKKKASEILKMKKTKVAS
ncbi:MAG: HEAT repeat domain-containing protein [Deltaproteobacteria bacterium]|nr:HEAT repeat domain-containing protein [Deltaproteobacteria bacterium]